MNQRIALDQGTIPLIARIARAQTDYLRVHGVVPTYVVMSPDTYRELVTEVKPSVHHDAVLTQVLGAELLITAAPIEAEFLLAGRP